MLESKRKKKKKTVNKIKKKKAGKDRENAGCVGDNLK